MAEEALNEEDQDEPDCPKCPPPGAPAWMATFADMATLLMAFFVLILSFAEFNVPKFKQISGSLREAFGVQKVVPVVEQPKGTTVISLNFSPNPTPAVTETLRQQTTELQKPELELQTKLEDSPEGGEADKKKDSDFDGAGGERKRLASGRDLVAALGPQRGEPANDPPSPRRGAIGRGARCAGRRYQRQPHQGATIGRKSQRAKP